MELAKRKPTRLRGFDYSTPGAYFVTICTYGRKQLLSQIIVGEGFHPLLQNKLTTIGEEVDASFNISTKITQVLQLTNM